MWQNACNLEPIASLGQFIGNLDSIGWRVVGLGQILGWHKQISIRGYKDNSGRGTRGAIQYCTGAQRWVTMQWRTSSMK